MRHVTICENLGPALVPGADHKIKFDRYRMVAGTCWDIHDDTRDHQVIEITETIAKAARYTWTLRFIDGRAVAVFEAGGAELAQPVDDDPRAKERRLGSSRKVRKPRRDAPGVAPEVSPDEGTAPLVAPRREGRKPRVSKPLALEPL